MPTVQQLVHVFAGTPRIRLLRLSFPKMSGVFADPGF